MRKILQSLFFLLSVLLLSSCTTVYYVGETSEPVLIYFAPDTTSFYLTTVPITKKVLIKGRPKRYSYVIYENHRGYAYRPVFTSYRRFRSEVDGTLYGYSTHRPTASSSGTSTTRSASSYTPRGGPVQVRGYYRKNGTYVRPHTRSAPTRSYRQPSRRR